MKLTGLVGLLTAFVSSLCCTLPLLTLVVGASGTAAGNWTWLEPLRPYTIALTVGALGWAWYNQLKPTAATDCACDSKRVSFWQTKRFLGLVTGVAILLLTLPAYTGWFSQAQTPSLQVAQPATQQIAYVTIRGMTCAGCEQHVKSELSKLGGIAKTTVSYAKSNAVVTFDPKQTSLSRIEKAVSATGYEVVAIKTNQGQ